MNVTPVIKNNPNIKYINLSFYPRQVDDFAPYLRNLTHLFFFAAKFPHRTWRILGKNLVSLVSLRTLDCHRLDDEDIVAWTSEMNVKNYALRNLEHLYSDVKHAAIAKHVAPKCPNLEYYHIGHDYWDDESLDTWNSSVKQISLVKLDMKFSHLNPEKLSKFLRKCENLRYLGIGPDHPKIEVGLDDSVIETIATSCTQLHTIDFQYVTNVTEEGWSQLRTLKPFKTINIGSDTCSQDFQRELGIFPVEKFNETPTRRAEREAEKTRKVEETRKKKEAERQKNIDWGLNFVAAKRDELITTCPDPNDFLTTAKEWVKQDPDFPTNTPAQKLVLQGVSDGAKRMKGEVLKARRGKKK